MTTAIYIIWALIPLFFLLMALWSFLENFSGKKNHERPGDFLRQGFFVLVCVAVCIAIDHYLLPGIVEALNSEFIPYEICQFALLPTVLYLAARIIGPTKPIQISKAPVSKLFKNR